MWRRAYSASRFALVAALVAAVVLDAAVSIPHILTPGGLIEQNAWTLAWIRAADSALPRTLAVHSLAVKDALKVVLVLGIARLWPSPYDVAPLAAAAAGAWTVTLPVLVLAV